MRRVSIQNRWKCQKLIHIGHHNPYHIMFASYSSNKRYRKHAPLSGYQIKLRSCWYMIDQLSLSLQVKPSKNKARNLPLLSFITAVSIFITVSPTSTTWRRPLDIAHIFLKFQLLRLPDMVHFFILLRNLFFMQNTRKESK